MRMHNVLTLVKIGDRLGIRNLTRTTVENLRNVPLRHAVQRSPTFAFAAIWVRQLLRRLGKSCVVGTKGKPRNNDLKQCLHLQ